MSFFENAQRWFQNNIYSQPIYSGMQNYAPTSNAVLAPLILLIIVPIIAIASLASWLFGGSSRNSYPAPSYSRNTVGSICGDDDYQTSHTRMNSYGIRRDQSCCQNHTTSYVSQPTHDRRASYRTPSQSTQMNGDVFISPTQSGIVGGRSQAVSMSNDVSGSRQSVSVSMR